MYKDSRRYTLSDIRSWDEEKVQVGYCELQNVFRYENRIGYHAGHFGWNFDVYDLGNKVILTGYRSMIGRKPKVDLKEYEKKAKDIYFKYGYGDKTKAALSELVKELAEKI